MNRTAWIVAIVIVVAPALGLQAQWLRYPTAGVPRLPNGQPDLSAPAPKTGDGNLIVRTNGFRDDLWADLNGNPLTDAKFQPLAVRK
jgi:hypothetical protein